MRKQARDYIIAASSKIPAKEEVGLSWVLMAALSLISSLP